MANKIKELFNSAQKIFEKVKQIIVDELGKDPGTITKEADLKNDLGITSIEMIGMVMEFEDTFNVEISEDGLEKIKTVGDIVDYIEEKAA
ncbi:MAG: acyl carrier protein [Clostridia bacterium]|nr:acyl carrier protein [Clostridia bacterium]MBR7083539.1 acyl carrier protein [Clostridia bacterium]